MSYDPRAQRGTSTPSETQLDDVLNATAEVPRVQPTGEMPSDQEIFSEVAADLMAAEGARPDVGATSPAPLGGRIDGGLAINLRGESGDPEADHGDAAGSSQTQQSSTFDEARSAYEPVDADERVSAYLAEAPEPSPVPVAAPPSSQQRLKVILGVSGAIAALAGIIGTVAWSRRGRS